MRQSRIFLLFCIFLLATTAPESITHPRPTKDHALFFAIQDYDAWTDLKNPIRDAEAIAQQLRGNYEFDDLKIVTNPTLETIQATLNQYLTKTYGPDDQLFIFFSGHGAFNDLTAEGFFIPKAGLKNDPFQNSYLPLTRLERIISNIPCAHILLTIDACYSGTFNESIALDKSDPTNPTWRRPGVDPGNGDAKAAWINSKLSKRSRICITSGGKERTSDGIEHSPLTEAFLKGLANPGEDAILTVDELVAGLKNLQPGPKTFPFGTHQSDGSFLFIQKEKAPTNFDLQSYEQRQRDIQAWTTAKSANTPAVYLDYLQKFPQGAFREEASKALAIVEEDQHWELARLDNTPAAYQAYLKRYPTGRYAPEAQKNLQLNTTLDSDSDGVPDTRDACPTEKGLARFDGCPDTDSDGIPDSNDGCPNQVGPASNRGCPLPSMSSFVDPFDGVMIFIKGGTFQMGYTEGNVNATPVHSVTVSDFYLAKTEVTQAQWRAIMGTDPSNFNGCDQCPVENVSWNDVQKFIKKLNANKKKSYRLPTEAEWEYAAREGQNSTYPYSGSNDLYEVAWNYFNSGNKTQPVGQKKPNALGLYDMSGNVWEWCQDWFGFDYYAKSPSINPQGPKTSTSRICRGGAWDEYLSSMHMAVRNSKMPDYPYSNVGFRLAR